MINEQNLNNQIISKQIESSLELLILYRSLYIIKEKFGLFKERIKNVYDKYNIYKNNYKLNSDIKIYQIDKKDFVQVTDEVFKDINILIIKYLNPKDIFLSKVMLGNKIDESLLILKEILDWLTNNNNEKYSIKNYNTIFFDKKIKPFIQENLEYENINENENKKEQKEENKNIEIKNDNEKEVPKNANSNNISMNDDFKQNFAQKEYVEVVEYNRRGHIVNKFNSKIEDENETIGEVVIDTINTDKIPKNNENDNILHDKELSIKLNNIDESSKLDINNKDNNNNDNINNSENIKIEQKTKNDKESKKIELNDNFLFIESLPLILADFLEQHLNNAIIESEDELAKELKTLFDKDILKKINNYENIMNEKKSLLNTINNNFLTKEEKQETDLDKALDDLKKIKDNIKLYKEILENKKKFNENIGYIEKMIEKLLSKEIWLEHKIKLLYEKNNIENNTNNNLNNTNTNNLLKTARNTGTSDISSIVNLENKFLTNNKSQLYNNTNGNRQLNESINNSVNTALLNDKSTTSIISNSNKTRVSNALQEIFTYYSKQHNIAGYTPLFENVEKKKSHLDLNEFSKFCSDFRIPIIRQKIVEIFKKNTSNLYNMNFKEFKNAIINLSNAAHESKKKSLKEKIKNKKNELNSIEFREKQIQEEKKIKRLLYDNEIQNLENSNSKGKDIKSKISPRIPSARVNLVLQKKNIFNDISTSKINYNKENKKTYQEIIDDFYDFLGLYSKQDYQSKMRGFLISPTKNSSNLNKEKSFLSGDANRSKSFKNDENEEINKIILNNRSERIKKELIDREKNKNLIYQEKLKLFDINNQRLKIIFDKKMKFKTYKDLMKEQKEEKNEVLSMLQKQENIVRNKLKEKEIKEKELKKSKEKERLKELRNNYIYNDYTLQKEESKDKEYNDKSKDITRIDENNHNTNHNTNNNTSNNIIINNNEITNNSVNAAENGEKNESENNQNQINEKETKQLTINDINKSNDDVKQEENEEEKKENDKNQIWWDKLENYDINDLGLNDEEKDIFVNSDISEDNDLISKISKNNVNSNNNSIGGLLLDNSLPKSSSIKELDKEKTKKPNQLPPISKKQGIKRGKIVELNSHNFNSNYNKKNNLININKSQNQKRTGLDEIKKRIVSGNNNGQNMNNRYKNMFKNKSASVVKTSPNNKSEDGFKYIKK